MPVIVSFAFTVIARAVILFYIHNSQNCEQKKKAKKDTHRIKLIFFDPEFIWVTSGGSSGEPQLQ